MREGHAELAARTRDVPAVVDAVKHLRSDVAGLREVSLALSASADDTTRTLQVCRAAHAPPPPPVRRAHDQSHAHGKLLPLCALCVCVLCGAVCCVCGRMLPWWCQDVRAEQAASRASSDALTSAVHRFGADLASQADTVTKMWVLRPCRAVEGEAGVVHPHRIVLC